MKLDEFRRKFPQLGQEPYLSKLAPYVEDASGRAFNEVAWKQMIAAGLQDFLAKPYDLLVFSCFFTTIKALLADERVMQNIKDKKVNFKDLVREQIKKAKEKAQTSYAQRPIIVGHWLDGVLDNVPLPADFESLMTDLVALLSPESVRTSLEQHPGGDVRELVKTGQIGIAEFIKIANQYAEPIKRDFPDWVGSGRALQVMAAQYTDSQLKVLGDFFSHCGITENLRKISLMTAILWAPKFEESRSVDDSAAFRRLVESMHQQTQQFMQSHGAATHAVVTNLVAPQFLGRPVSAPGAAAADAAVARPPTGVGKYGVFGDVARKPATLPQGQSAGQQESAGQEGEVARQDMGQFGVN